MSGATHVYSPGSCSVVSEIPKTTNLNHLPSCNLTIFPTMHWCTSRCSPCTYSLLNEVVLFWLFIGWVATVQKNQTVNLYKLDDVLKMTSTAGLIVQPWHVIFSSCQLNCISFVDANTLVAGSPTNRTLSLWAGLDCLVKWMSSCYFV